MRLVSVFGDTILGNALYDFLKVTCEDYHVIIKDDPNADTVIITNGSNNEDLATCFIRNVLDVDDIVSRCIDAKRTKTIILLGTRLSKNLNAEKLKTYTNYRICKYAVDQSIELWARSWPDIKFVNYECPHVETNMWPKDGNPKQITVNEWTNLFYEYLKEYI